VPQLQNHFGLRGLLAVAGSAAILGFLLTNVLPEPAGRSLEDVSGEDEDRSVASLPLSAPIPIQD